MTACEVDGLTVAFGQHVVLRDVSLRIDRGAALGLIGPNGAGKTTLIDAITGFVPYHGSVRAAGEPLDGMPPHQRVRCGVVRTFQAMELFDDVSVHENVAVSPLSSPASVDAALAATGLFADAHRPAGSLPRASRRLVGLARALACSPQVLLVDEIVAGLDGPECAALAGTLNSVVASGVALLVVDHNLAFVEDLCAQVLVLEGGAVGPALPTRAAAVDTGPAQAVPRVGGTAAIEVAQLTVDRDDGTGASLRDTSVAVESGEIVAVRDAHDAAKSAFVGAVSGLLAVSAGSIRLAGVDITKHSVEARARLGMATVAEARMIFQGLTVGENLRVAGLHRSGVVPWTATWFPVLVPMIDRRAGLLSGGEQALLALARALATSPRVLLVDEISAGLAPGSVDVVIAALRRAASDMGTAVVLAEQHPDLIAVAHRVHDLH